MVDESPSLLSMIHKSAGRYIYIYTYIDVYSHMNYTTINPAVLVNKIMQAVRALENPNQPGAVVRASGKESPRPLLGMCMYT